jgi:hypothetical protein
MVKAITLFLILVTTPVFASVNLQVDLPWDYDQIEIDGKLIERSKFTMRIDFDRPSHRYYLVINTLDVLTTYHAVQQGYASEANPLLPADPSLTRLIAHKLIWTEMARYGGLFWEEDESFVYFANFLVTLAVINNTLIIIDNE